MPRKRTRKLKLPQWFDDCANPIAIVDASFEVIHANDACCKWLDVAGDSLVGETLQYTSDASDDSRIANSNPASGICPPPDMFDPMSESANSSNRPLCSRPSQRTGYIFTKREQPNRWMSASFILLKHTDDDSPIVIVIGSGTPLPNRPTSERLELPQELHEQLAQLHLEDTKVYSAASLVGASDFSKRLQRQVKAVSSNNSDCLVIGPKGAGREHLARTIFNERNTDQVRLVPVHCAIADNELIQVSIKEWVFDQRASHTKDWLLLLNVDHMSIEAQSELWGYTQLPDFELRIIATAEQSLLALAERGEYNASLAHFLSVQVIELLPLAQRKEDIPLLTQKFIESCNRESKHQVGGVDDDTNELLLEYDWPGNIDELQQTINHACEQSKRSTLEPGDLPDAFRHGLSASRIGYHETEKIELDEFLAEIERELIERAMRQTGNNRTKASDLLSISRARLIRRASALGIIKSSPKQSDKDQVVDESAFKPADEE